MSQNLCFTYQAVMDLIAGSLVDRYMAPHWLAEALQRLELGVNKNGSLVHVVRDGVGWRTEGIETVDLISFDEETMKVKIIKGD